MGNPQLRSSCRSLSSRWGRRGARRTSYVRPRIAEVGARTGILPRDHGPSRTPLPPGQHCCHDALHHTDTHTCTHSGGARRTPRDVNKHGGTCQQRELTRAIPCADDGSPCETDWLLECSAGLGHALAVHRSAPDGTGHAGTGALWRGVACRVYLSHSLSVSPSKHRTLNSCWPVAPREATRRGLARWGGLRRAPSQHHAAKDRPTIRRMHANMPVGTGIGVRGFLCHNGLASCNSCADSSEKATRTCVGLKCTHVFMTYSSAHVLLRTAHDRL